MALCPLNMPEWRASERSELSPAILTVLLRCSISPQYTLRAEFRSLTTFCWACLKMRSVIRVAPIIQLSRMAAESGVSVANSSLRRMGVRRRCILLIFQLLWHRSIQGGQIQLI